MGKDMQVSRHEIVESTASAIAGRTEENLAALHTSNSTKESNEP